MIKEVFAYLRVNDAAAAITFYHAAFGATEKFRLTEPDGRIGHAELDFGGVTVMLSDEYPEYAIVGPLTLKGTSVGMHLHVDNADRVMASAIDAGATLEREAQDEFYGERGGVIVDPFGHRWQIGHTIEELSPEEMQRRYTEMMTTPPAQ